MYRVFSYVKLTSFRSYRIIVGHVQMSLRLAFIGLLNGVFSSINSVSFRLHCITVGHVQMSRSVQFSSVQDGICALEKSRIHSAQSLRSFPKVAFVSIIKLVPHHFTACFTACSALF